MRLSISAVAATLSSLYRPIHACNAPLHQRHFLCMLCILYVSEIILLDSMQNGSIGTHQGEVFTVGITLAPADIPCGSESTMPAL